MKKRQESDAIWQLVRERTARPIYRYCGVWTGLSEAGHPECATAARLRSKQFNPLFNPKGEWFAGAEFSQTKGDSLTTLSLSSSVNASTRTRTPTSLKCRLRRRSCKSKDKVAGSVIPNAFPTRS